MLSPDVRIDGFDAPDWFALGRLFQGGAAGPARPHGGGLLVLREQDAAIKVVSTTRGRLPPPEGPMSVGALVAEHGASWALAGDTDGLHAVMERLAERLVREDDFLDQLLKLAHVLRELSREGHITTYPRDAQNLRIPSRATLERGLDAICPIGKVILVGAYEGGSLLTSIALRRGRRGFDHLMGPDGVRGELGLVSGSWARDYRGLVRAVELGLGPVAFGAFAPVDVFRRLVGDDRPGRWTAAFASQEIVLHPFAPAVAIPLGIDAGRAAVAFGARLAHRLGISGQASGRAAISALERLRSTDAAHEAERLLGFDPLALVAEALSMFTEDR